MTAQVWNAICNYIAFVGGAQFVQYMEFGGQYPFSAIFIGIAFAATLNALHTVTDNLRQAAP